MAEDLNSELSHRRQIQQVARVGLEFGTAGLQVSRADHSATLPLQGELLDFTVLQRNLREWHERPWTYVCEC